MHNSYWTDSAESCALKFRGGPPRRVEIRLRYSAVFADGLILAFVRFRVGFGIMRLRATGTLPLPSEVRFGEICGLGIVDVCRNCSFAADRIRIFVGHMWLLFVVSTRPRHPPLTKSGYKKSASFPTRQRLGFGVVVSWIFPCFVFWKTPSDTCRTG